MGVFPPSGRIPYFPADQHEVRMSTVSGRHDILKTCKELLMQNISTCLWFDNNAEEAVNFN